MLTDDLIATFAAAQAVIDRLMALTGRLRHAFRKLNITSRAEFPASLDT